MFTGRDIWNQFLQGIGQDWTGSYASSVKTNRLLNKSFILAVEDKYDANDTQKTRDALSFLVKTNGVFNLNNNQIYVVPLQISNVQVLGTFAVVTTLLPHNILNNQTVTIAGVAGFTVNPNGSFIVVVNPGSTNDFTIQITSTTGSYTPETGTVTYPNMISDYWHYLTSYAKYSVPVYDFNVKTCTGSGVPIILTIDWYNNIATGEELTISGIFGNTDANGTFFAKKLNEFNVALFSDETFQTPIIGNGAYMGGGSFARTYYNVAKPYLTDTKIGTLNLPTSADPKYELSSLLIKYYPLPPVICSEISIDYIRQPIVVMDVTDTKTDYTLYYPQVFINEIIAKMMKFASGELRDDEDYQFASQENNEEAQP